MKDPSIKFEGWVVWRKARPFFTISCILAMCLSGCAHSPGAGTQHGLIAWYQTTISPVDGDRCPMTPSCSSYAQQAFQKHGAFWGWIMTCDRLMRCGRDETRLSPHVVETNAIRTLDPVWMNDFCLETGQSPEIGGEGTE